MKVQEIIKARPDGVVAKAYAFAEHAHRGQKRSSGEPYFRHVLQTAQYLADWHLDEPTIAAGLLHDTVEDTGVTVETIKKEFGEEIAFLVDGVTKLGRIKYRGTEAKVENLRKMIVALSEDLRVIFIKLADRLHNMTTLNAVPPQKQKRIALETEDIYAPLAYRLGMQHVSGELQDLAFPYLHPREVKWLEEHTLEQYEIRTRYLKKIKPLVEELLSGHGINPIKIDFRAKRLSSLYKKLLRNGMDIEKIHDLVALRIIVNNTEECYAALGLIHGAWPPLPGRIKDYIAMPKPNGYRSLHTTIIGPEKKMVEFQIRTKEMHEEAETGVAAHWVYKQKQRNGLPKSPRIASEDELLWVQELRRWQEVYGEQIADPGKFLETMKVDFFRKRIFAITPHGEVIDLPSGATPVDFAYHIHSDVGNQCVGAKVNQRIVPLDYELQSGDMVEIITQKNKKPSEDWLKFAKTGAARDKIRSALRKKHRLFERPPSKVEFRIVVEDRTGLIKDVSIAIARSHVSISHLETNASPGSKFPIDKVICDTGDKQKIEKLVLKLKQIKGIREITYKLI